VPRGARADREERTSRESTQGGGKLPFGLLPLRGAPAAGASSPSGHSARCSTAMIHTPSRRCGRSSRCTRHRTGVTPPPTTAWHHTASWRPGLDAIRRGFGSRQSTSLTSHGQSCRCGDRGAPKAVVLHLHPDPRQRRPSGPHRFDVDREARAFCAGGDRVHDVVTVEKEDDSASARILTMHSVNATGSEGTAGEDGRVNRKKGESEVRSWQRCTPRRGTRGRHALSSWPPGGPN
jgi:hypothetical protein